MIDWHTIKPAIYDFVRSASGRPAIPVHWTNDPACNSWDAERCEMQITNIATVGDDDTIYTVDETTEREDVTICGNREFVLELSFYARDQGAVTAARRYAERVAAATSHPVYYERLRLAGVAIAEIGEILNLDVWNDGVVESREVLELTCACGSEFTDPEVQRDYVREVVYSGQFTDADDTVAVTVPETTITETGD